MKELRPSNLWIFIISLLLIFSGCDSTSRQNAPETGKPNILLINIDDLGWRDLGYMGSNYYETPHIDQLAAGGMVFSNAYATAANCAPSRAALFTGQNAPRTGIYTVNTSERGRSEDRKLIPTPNTLYIEEEDLTIAEVLQEHGYKTAHVGKWHISKNPARDGFDRNIGGLEAGNPSWGGELGGYFAPFNNPHLEEAPEGTYLTDYLTKKTIAFLENDSEQPFFINYAPYAVHTPIQPKETLKNKYEQKTGSNGHDHPGYAAMIETMDRNVGRLIDHLQASGAYKNTFILFTSDNGGVFRITKQWPLRAGKGSYYEGGIRVPMIVVWPGIVEPGTSANEPVTNLDFFPTFLDIAGIDPPEDKVLDGDNLVPLLKGNNLSDRNLVWHFPIYLQNGNKETPDTLFRTRPGSVVQNGPWKLHEYFEDGRLELYNLNTDIGEDKDLSGLYPEKTRELHRQLKQWRERMHAPVPTEPNPEYEGKK